MASSELKKTCRNCVYYAEVSRKWKRIKYQCWNIWRGAEYEEGKIRPVKIKPEQPACELFVSRSR